MELIFYQTIIEPIVKKATETAKEALGPHATPEQINKAVFEALYQFLQLFTHATTVPTDYVGKSIGLIEATIAAAPTPKPKTKFD